MKRLLFVIFTCLSLCSYAQMPFSSEVVTGSFSSLKGQSANLEIVYNKIHGMPEADFAAYETDWNDDKPEIESLIWSNIYDAVKSKCHLDLGNNADLTVRIVVNSVSVKGDHSFELHLLDKNDKVLGKIEGLFGKGGMFGTKLNLIKDGAKSTGKRAGALLKKYIN